MELGGLFPTNTSSHSIALTPLEVHANGNKRSSFNTLTTFNNIGSDNRGSVPALQSNMRTSRGFYSRLPPIGRSGTCSTITNDSKQHREASESKLNALFNHYKASIYQRFYSKFESQN